MNLDYIACYFLIIIVFGSTRRRLMIISSIQRLYSTFYVLCVVYFCVYFIRNQEQGKKDKEKYSFYVVMHVII